MSNLSLQLLFHLEALQFAQILVVHFIVELDEVSLDIRGPFEWVGFQWLHLQVGLSDAILEAQIAGPLIVINVDVTAEYWGLGGHFKEFISSGRTPAFVYNFQLHNHTHWPYMENKRIGMTHLNDRNCNVIFNIRQIMSK